MLSVYYREGRVLCCLVLAAESTTQFRVIMRVFLRSSPHNHRGLLRSEGGVHDLWWDDDFLAVVRSNYQRPTSGPRCLILLLCMVQKRATYKISRHSCRHVELYCYEFRIVFRTPAKLCVFR